MKKLFILLNIFLSFQLIGQSDSLFLDELRASLDVQNFEEVINRTADVTTLSEDGKYLRGCAFYYLDKEEEALKLFDGIIASDSTSRGSRYFKSRIHFGREEYNIALQTINDALNYVEDDPDYFSLKGEILANKGNLEESIPILQKALTMDNCSEFNYLLLADIYEAVGKYDEGADLLRGACTTVGEESYYYEMILFETAINYFKRDNPAGAKDILIKLRSTHPSPKNTEKLIQAHYALGEYKAGDAYKEELYKAHEAGSLPEELKEEFCFDQYSFGDKYIIVVERFAEPEGLYYKHVFYVLDNENKLLETFQTEWSFAVEQTGKKYVLGGTINSDEGRRHNSYWSYTFDENFNYDELKKAISDIMSGKGDSPSASSTYGKQSEDIDTSNLEEDATDEKVKGKKKKKNKKKKKKE